MNKIVKMILDTDLGADCDDAGAIAVAHALADLGETQILAITHCTSLDCAIGCIDAINIYYGRSLPIGSYKKDGFKDAPELGAYAKYVYDNFPHGYNTRADAPDAVSLLRKTLAEDDEGNIVIVAIGPLNNLHDLLESGADEFSPLDGIELVAQKVDKMVIMGGFFHMDGDVVWGHEKMEGEYNIVADIKSAQGVFDNSPVPIILSSYEIGQKILTGKPLIDRSVATPVGKSYEVYCNGNRESWDLTAVLYAVRGEAPFWKIHEYGEIKVDDKGVTTWRKSTSNKHSYLITDMDPSKVEDELNKLLLSEPKKEKALC
jgi:inosine-uridine nucleoside N-ribohydrolase